MDERSSCSGIGKVDLSRRELRWLGPDGFSEKRAGLRYFSHPFCGADQLLQDPYLKLPDIPAVRALLGPPNVCQPGSWSPGQRCYFHKNWSEGFFSAEWVEGYDLQKGRIFKVRTLDHHLYSE